MWRAATAFPKRDSLVDFRPQVEGGSENIPPTESVLIVLRSEAKRSEAVNGSSAGGPSEPKHVRLVCFFCRVLMKSIRVGIVSRCERRVVRVLGTFGVGSSA